MDYSCEAWSHLALFNHSCIQEPYYYRDSQLPECPMIATRMTLKCPWRSITSRLSFSEDDHTIFSFSEQDHTRYSYTLNMITQDYHFTEHYHTRFAIHQPFGSQSLHTQDANEIVLNCELKADGCQSSAVFLSLENVVFLLSVFVSFPFSITGVTVVLEGSVSFFVAQIELSTDPSRIMHWRTTEVSNYCQGS